MAGNSCREHSARTIRSKQSCDTVTAKGRRCGVTKTRILPEKAPRALRRSRSRFEIRKRILTFYSSAHEISFDTDTGEQLAVAREGHYAFSSPLPRFSVISQMRGVCRGFRRLSWEQSSIRILRAILAASTCLAWSRRCSPMSEPRAKAHARSLTRIRRTGSPSKGPRSFARARARDNLSPRRVRPRFATRDYIAHFLEGFVSNFNRLSSLPYATE